MMDGNISDWVAEWSGQVAGILPSAVQTTVALLGNEEVLSQAFARLSALLALLQQQVLNCSAAVSSLLAAGASATLAGKVAAAILWLDRLHDTNPAELVEALHRLLGVFRDGLSGMRQRLPIGSVGQLLHENLTSEMVVYSLGEVFLFIVPLINRERLWPIMAAVMQYLRLWLLRTLAHLCAPYRRLKAAIRQATLPNSGVENAHDTGIDVGQQCVSCLQLPAVPYAANCSHTFCYGCVRTLSGQAEEFPCPRCQLYVVYLQPASAEDPASSGS